MRAETHLLQDSGTGARLDGVSKSHFTGVFLDGSPSSSSYTMCYLPVKSEMTWTGQEGSEGKGEGGKGKAASDCGRCEGGRIGRACSRCHNACR